ncbi:MAG: DUF3108 domain-containing protein [Pseudomonadota bacterium]
MNAIRTMIRTAALAAAVGAVALAQPVAAQEKSSDQATFDLVIKGITAGTLSFSATQSGKGYGVQGKLQSSGLAALVRKVRYDARVKGSVSKGRYSPTSYAEKADTGKRQSESVMAYKRGVPQVVSYTPPRDPGPNDVAASTMGGTVDPLTALYATLRDVAPGQECNVSVRMFDGKRSSQIGLGKPRADGDTVVCSGEYRRLKGFSAEEMAEKVRFPFTLTYAPTGDGKMRVMEVAMDSLYGKARLTRR